MVKSIPMFHVKHPCAPVEPTRRGAPSMRPMPRGKRPAQAKHETSGRRRRRGSAPPACHWHVAGSDSPRRARNEGERVAGRDGIRPITATRSIRAGKGTTRRKDGGLTSRTATPPRRYAATARGRLAGTHRLAIVERTPRHRALPTRAHRHARAPRTTLAPPPRSSSRRASARPVRTRAKRGGDSEAPATNEVQHAKAGSRSTDARMFHVKHSCAQLRQTR